MANDIRRLKVGAFQFSVSDQIETNLKALIRGIEEASRQNVRLLLTQECALCGYPPVEIPSLDAIDGKGQLEALNIIQSIASEKNMYIALGFTSLHERGAFNSVALIAPGQGMIHTYHKRALWGWDLDNFLPGNEAGVVVIDGIKVGIRICFEVRFPEYFRELYRQGTELCLVSLTDIGKEEHKEKLSVIRSHLVSRAVENTMYILSANSISQYQLAPTALINPDGIVIKEAPLNQEALITAEIEISPPHFGRKGRRFYSDQLLNLG